MAQRTKEEELQRLKRQINEWNENRLDLFELSLPNEVFISLLGSLRSGVRYKLNKVELRVP